MAIEGVVELPDIGLGSGSGISLRLVQHSDAAGTPSSTVAPSDTVEHSDILLSSGKPTINSTTCLSLYDGWNIDGDIYPYYELRRVNVSWRGIKVIIIFIYIIID